MRKATLKELRITYSVLQKLKTGVPSQLLVTLADKIKAEEKAHKNRKIARMSEEELIHYQSVPRRKLRINLPDGRIIQEKTNENTFYTALRELDFSQVLALGLKRKSIPLFVGFDQPRKLLTGYKMLHEGCFVLRSIKPDERFSLLHQIDEALQLNWDILLM